MDAPLPAGGKGAVEHLFFSTRALRASNQPPPHPGPAGADYCAEDEQLQCLGRIVLRVSKGASTRACSQDLVKYVQATPEPLSMVPKGGVVPNPWIVDPNASAAGSGGGCCIVQ